MTYTKPQLSHIITYIAKIINIKYPVPIPKNIFQIKFHIFPFLSKSFIFSPISDPPYPYPEYQISDTPNFNTFHSSKDVYMVHFWQNVRFKSIEVLTPQYILTGAFLGKNNSINIFL